VEKLGREGPARAGRAKRRGAGAGMDSEFARVGPEGVVMPVYDGAEAYVDTEGGAEDDPQVGAELGDTDAGSVGSIRATGTGAGI
jgi:hypothetical protein